MSQNEHKVERRFWDIPSAANQAGYSSRHFRRIIEEQGIPILRIGRKFFILGRDLENWRLTNDIKAHEMVKVAS
jgi:transposase InsO family protein